MSDTDSFIEEVTEEVRRDQLFSMLKKYGWIAVLAIFVIVGGAAWNEYSKAQTRAAAEKLGDDIVAALAHDSPAARAEALSAITSESAGGSAILNMMVASAEVESDQKEAAVGRLEEVAANGDLPEIYREIAEFKALTLQGDSLPVPDRRLRFEAMATSGRPLRLMAAEQLALIDVSEGLIAPAIEKLQEILQDAAVGQTQRQRVMQAIVALGGTPELPPSAQG